VSNEPEQTDFSEWSASTRVCRAMSLIKLYLYTLLLEKEEPYPNGQEPLRYDE